MDVEIVESDQINPIQLDAWSQLFGSTPQARFYHHPHWHQCIAAHLLPEHLNLGFLTVGNQLQMVLPMCSAAGERHRTHPLHDHLSLNDVLIHPLLAEDANQLLDAIQLTLDSLGSSWWDWKVSNLAHESALTQMLSKTLCLTNENGTTPNRLEHDQNGTSIRWSLRQTRESASFNCTGDERAPMGKLRRNLRRLRKQINEHGELRIEVVVNSDQLNDAYEQFLTIEASGWKGTGDEAPAISANSALQGFYQALLSPSIAGFDPQINLLWCNDVCIAAQFGVRTDACLSLLKIGYNEEYARFSPGYLLLESILDKTPELGIKTLSLVTSPPWAQRWHPDIEPVWQLNHYNSSTIGTALHKIDGIRHVVKNRLRQAA